MHNPAKTFIQRLSDFQHEFSGDPRWELVFSNGKRKWFYIVVSYYNGIYYISERIGDHAPIQVNEQGEMTANAHYGGAHLDEKKWQTLFSLALEYLDRVEKDWVGEYRQLVRKFPYKYRQGLIHSKLVRHYCPEAH